MTQTIENLPMGTPEFRAIQQMVSIIFGAINRDKRGLRCGGYRLSFKEVLTHMGRDERLTREVLTAARFAPCDDDSEVWTTHAGRTDLRVPWGAFAPIIRLYRLLEA